MAKKYNVLIEQDEDGVYIGRAIELKGCITQGDTLDELMKNIKEAIELYIEVNSEKNLNEEQIKFIGVSQVEDC
jgi:predicted RNase H-like HicB family nuclease